MKSWKILMVAGLAARIAGGAGQVHGPICVWHEDPTSTMTIQWVEIVQAEMPPNMWLEAKAGFGYADNDDETKLAMAEKHQRLYIRKEFEAKEVPRSGTANPVGTWQATSTVDKKPLTMTLIIEKEGDAYKGKAMSLLYGVKPLKDIKVDGKKVEFALDIEYEKKTYTVKLSTEEKEPGRLAGEYSVEGEKVKDKFEAKREKTSEDGKNEPPQDDIKHDAFQLLLKIRYDDAFIAYLNGHEIARRGVGKGSGKDAQEIVSHDAKDEETVEIDKALNKHLRSGKNVLAIEGHNSKIDSSDFSLDPKFILKTDKEHVQIDGKEVWQFYLGDPAADWKTNITKAEKPSLLASNVTPFEIKYAPRGDNDIKTARVVPSAFAQTGNVVHRVSLTQLQPNTEYSFTIHEIGRSERFRGRKWFFRTAPAKLSEPLRFVAGGDMFHKRELLDAMNRVAARQNPLFALLGGDLAYTNDKEHEKWYDWIDSWSAICVNADDTMIPMVIVIGNHECDVNIDGVKEEERKDFKPEEHAREFLSLFPMPNGRTYYAIDFSNYMSIICLDSEHLYTAKAQESFLREALMKRRNCPNLFACYHRPIYGTQVKDDQANCKEPWVPLFEEYGVDVVFENDHHCFKRTMPIKKDKIDLDGVTYLGDGAWGVDVRKVPWEKASLLDYIVRGEDINHLYRVLIMEDRQQFDAFNKEGIRFDNYVRWRR